VFWLEGIKIRIKISIKNKNKNKTKMLPQACCDSCGSLLSYWRNLYIDGKLKEAHIKDMGCEKCIIHILLATSPNYTYPSLPLQHTEQYLKRNVIMKEYKVNNNL
jgi:hypothetical protein